MKEWLQKAVAASTKRRQFLKWSTAVSGAALTSATLPLKAVATETAFDETKTEASSGCKTTWSACMVNCGSRCALQVHTHDGVITHIESDNRGDDSTFGKHQIRACLRGRSIRGRVYNPDRLKYPMKRIGARGEGRFERISWDEAFDLIAEKLKYTIKEYGNDAIFMTYGSGTSGYYSDGPYAVRRFLNTIGGYLSYHGNYSWGQMMRALPFTYGTQKRDVYGSYTSEIKNAKLLVMFGYNPAETRMSGGGEIYEYTRTQRENDVRTIIIDPRYTDTMLGKEDQWIPIRPGSDAALVEAIAYVLITENLVDQEFLDQYCQGFDEKTMPEGAPANGHYKAHILGQGPDGIAKTPEWASKITSIPTRTIIQLAREIGTTKPVFIVQGIGIQRQANGEQSCRAIAMLPILTGNIGLPGTHTSDMPGNYLYPVLGLPTPANQVKAQIPFFLWTDAITRAHEMTDKTDGILGAERLQNPIKFIISYAGNTLINQHSDINKTTSILRDESLAEFLLVIDNHMTPTARFADLLLPDVTTIENTDVTSDGYSSGSMGGVFPLTPAIAPIGECMSAYQMLTEVAKRMGVEEQFTEGRTHEQWVEHLYDIIRERDARLPTLEQLRKDGPFQVLAPEKGRIALEDFRNDPVNHALNTPSGKIEIYSTELAKIAETWILPEGDVISALPKYVTTWESHLDPKTKEYPLQLFGFHTKGHVHSTYYNIPILREAVMEGLWINPMDAKARGIADGDLVKVWNDRGETRIQAKITPRIMPGVVALGEGAWYKPRKDGVDTGGSINMLTSQRPTPLSKGNPQHTNLVQIAKA